MSRNLIVFSLVVALVGLAGIGLTRTETSAQEESGDLAEHPLTGTWLVLANPPLPEDSQPFNWAYFGADGSVQLMFPPTQVGPQGVVFNSSYGGTWERDDERTGHFTAVQLLSDANGTFLGTTTVDGYPMVSEDGQTFIDDGSRVTVTIRDPAGAVVQTIPPSTGGRPVTGTRMSPGNPGFPAATPAAGTPPA